MDCYYVEVGLFMYVLLLLHPQSAPLLRVGSDWTTERHSERPNVSMDKLDLDAKELSFLRRTCVWVSICHPFQEDQASSFRGETHCRAWF